MTYTLGPKDRQRPSCTYIPVNNIPVLYNNLSSRRSVQTSTESQQFSRSRANAVFKRRLQSLSRRSRRADAVLRRRQSLSSSAEAEQTQCSNVDCRVSADAVAEPTQCWDVYRVSAVQQKSSRRSVQTSTASQQYNRRMS